MSENYGTSNSQFENEGTQQVNVNPQNNLPEEYKPLGMWAYFGYEILFSIPIVGLIFLLVFSFGGTKNINLRNFARSYFCFVIIVAVLVAIFAAIFIGAKATGTGTTYYNVTY